MLRKLLLALALSGGLCAPALAQVQNDLSGNETWNVGQGPGGPGADITSNLVRNSTEHRAGTLTGATTIGVTAGWTALRWGGNILLTAQPSAAVLTLPPNPFPDGGIIGYCNTTAAPFATNVVTVTANTGQTVSNGGVVTTQAANSCAYFQFNRPTTTWYRIS